MEENQARPFLKWPGGKTQLLSQFKSYFPQELLKGKVKRYIEPFLGSGAVFFHIFKNYKVSEAILADINRELVLTYRVVQKDNEKLIRFLKEMEKKYIPLDEEKRKEYYLRVRASFNINKDLIGYRNYEEAWIKRAAQVIFLNKTCYNGLFRFNQKGAFNSPHGSYLKPKICDETNLAHVSKILEKVEIRIGDFEEIKTQLKKNTFVYLDPPYKPISKTSNFTSYSSYVLKDEGQRVLPHVFEKEEKVSYSNVFDDSEQKRLAKFLDLIDTKGALFMLSNSEPKNIDPENDFFDRIYKNYYINNVYAARMINSKGDKRGKIKEILVTNYKTEREDS